MRKLRTLDEVTEEYFRDHSDEIDDYLLEDFHEIVIDLMEVFQDFAKDNDTGALLASLRILARVRGIGNMATDRKSVV